MGRPPLNVGTAGTYRFYPTKRGWEANCKYRDYDGVVRYIRRAGATKNGARLALDLAVRDRVYLGGNADHTPDTLVEVIADAWIANLKAQGSKGLGTIQQYEGNLERCLKPGVGKLRIRELGNVAACERYLKTIKDKRGAATAKTARSVLSGVCGYAARNNLIDRNPVRDTETITVKKKTPVSLTNAEVLDLRIWLTYDEKAIRRDLPDLVAFMLATGLRISEASAIHWEDVDLTAGSVRLRGNVIRVKGVGLIIQEDESNKLKKRKLDLPRWCVLMLRRRRPANAHGPVFTSARGKLRDPSNTEADLKEAFEWCGYAWVTSHVFRKTVATIMKEAGLTSRAAADQLGHEKVSMTEDNYYGRDMAATGAAPVLEALDIDAA